jgi:hypothetical protein
LSHALVVLELFENARQPHAVILLIRFSIDRL